MSYFTVMMLPIGDAASDNPYVRMLIGAIHSDSALRVEPYNWRRALRGDADVVHVHWPEWLLRSTGHFAEIKNLLKLAILIVRSRLLGRPRFVQTIHNINPHENGRLVERIGLSLWRRSVDMSIYLTEPTDAEYSQRYVTIPHGDYRPFISQLDTATTFSRTGLLLFGYLRPYKRIDDLIEAVGGIPSERLLVTGPAGDDTYVDHLVSLASQTQNTRVVAERLTDQHLLDLIRSVEMVILPYQNMYNSGAALLALTCRTPVILTKSKATEALQKDYGELWVKLLPSAWGADDVAAALRSTRESGAIRAAIEPECLERGWSRIAKEHVALYRQLSRR